MSQDRAVLPRNPQTRKEFATGDTGYNGDGKKRKKIPGGSLRGSGSRLFDFRGKKYLPGYMYSASGLTLDLREYENVFNR